MLILRLRLTPALCSCLPPARRERHWRIHRHQVIPEDCLRTLTGVRMLEHVARVSHGSHHTSDEGLRRLEMRLGAPEVPVLYSLPHREDTWSVALRTTCNTLLPRGLSPANHRHCLGVPIRASTVLRSRTSPLCGRLPSTCSPNTIPSSVFSLLLKASCAALMQKSVASRC